MESYSRIDALLVGYENQENLGLRSILSYLFMRGYKAELVPFIPGYYDNVRERINYLRPRLVGFSLIFQYSLDEFGKLMRFLRISGVKAHFTVGGHYPSLRPKETLELFPELNSVVRFEGEFTLPELLDNLEKLDHWKNIRSLAFRHGEQVIINPVRPLINNLDSLPPVHRDKPLFIKNEVCAASMFASRGCLFNCSFCSIRKFYGSVPGMLRRTRSPKAVVDEMHILFKNNGIRFFTFQDDDFAARSPKQREWLQEFIQELSIIGLSDKVKWKISCRVDDLEPKLLEVMIEHGLIAVYLGVESGSERGLKILNKHVTVKQNFSAVELLKHYDLAMAIGFMLFDPSTTIDTLRENIDFLRIVGSDGYFPINFCKMLPYAGTKIEEQLRSEGRLKGTASRPDYIFSDQRIANYTFLVQRIFAQRNFSSIGNVMRLQKADFDYRLRRSIGDDISVDHDNYSAALRKIIIKSNMQSLSTLDILLNLIIDNEIETLIDEQTTLLYIAEQEWRCEAEVEAELMILQKMTGSIPHNTEKELYGEIK